MPQSPLLTCPLPGGLLAYSLPIVLSMLTTQLYSVCDAMLLGTMMGPSALAAASNASALIMLALVVSGGLELGGGLYIGTLVPTAKQRDISEGISAMLLLSLLFSLPLTLAALLALPRLLLLIQTPPEVQSAAVLYGRIYVLSLPLIMLYDLSRQALMALGNSRLPMRMVLVTSCLNLLLDVPGIRYFGIAGAAAASALSQGIGCIWILLHLKGKGHLTLHLPQFRRHILAVLRLSVPNMLQQMAGPLLSNVQQSFLGLLGTAAIAAFAGCSRLTGLISMTLGGFIQGLVLFLVQNLSAEKTERAREGWRLMTRIIFGIALAMVLVLVIFSGPLLTLFTRDPQVHAMGRHLLTLVAPASLLSALRFLAEARLRAHTKMGWFALSTLLPSVLNVGIIGLLLAPLGFDAFIAGPYLSGALGLLFTLFLARTCPV